MEQKEKSAQELKALEQVKKAQANLAKVRREEKAKARKEQDHRLCIQEQRHSEPDNNGS